MINFYTHCILENRKIISLSNYLLWWFKTRAILSTISQINLHHPHGVHCLPSSLRPHYQSQCSRPGRTVILKNSPVAPVRDFRGRMWWRPMRVRDVCFLLTDVLRCVPTGPLGSVCWPGQRAYISAALHCCLTRRRQAQKTTNFTPSVTSAPLFLILIYPWHMCEAFAHLPYFHRLRTSSHISPPYKPTLKSKQAKVQKCAQFTMVVFSSITVCLKKYPNEGKIFWTTFLFWWPCVHQNPQTKKKKKVKKINQPIVTSQWDIDTSSPFGQYAALADSDSSFLSGSTQILVKKLNPVFYLTESSKCYFWNYLGIITWIYHIRMFS